MADCRQQIRHPVLKKRVWVSGKTQGDLEHRVKTLQDIRRDLRAGICTTEQAMQRSRGPTGQRHSLAELWPRFFVTLGERSKRQALSAWRNQIEKKLGALQPHELTAERMASWESSLLSPHAGKPEGYAPKTVQIAWWVVQRILRICAGLELMPWRPYKPRADKLVRQLSNNAGARRPRRAIRSVAELQEILAAAHQLDQSDDGDRLILCGFLALTGLRQAEAAGLSWDFVHLNAAPPVLEVVYQAPRDWHVAHPGAREGATVKRPKLTPKNGPRPQELHQTVVLLLTEQRKRLERRGHYSPTGPVFPSPITGTWRRSGWVLRPKELRRVLSHAGIEPEYWNTHSLRHSLATLELQASRGNLRAVQSRTGHRSLKILEGYIHQFGAGFSGSHVAKVSLPLELASPKARTGFLFAGAVSAPKPSKKLPGGPVGHLVGGLPGQKRSKPLPTE